MSVRTEWHETHGGGEVGERIRAMDWSQSPLGVPARWPAALRMSLSSMLATAIPMAIAWGTGYLLFYNDAYRAVFGLAHERALGRPLAEVWPDQWPLLGPGLRRVVEQRETIAFHDRPLHARAGGIETTRWFTGSWSPICDEAGAACGVLTTLYETTARVLAERERRKTIEALQAADRQKDEFLAMLGHELRNPLAPVVNSLRLLERTEPLSERARQALSIAQRQVQQLGRLVDDLLDVSRITHGQIRLRAVPVDAAELVRSAVESLRAGFEERAQRVSVVLPDTALHIVADPLRLTQVLVNLLHNSGKYTPEGGAIEIAAQPLEGGGVRVVVRDDGVGIAADLLPRIFEMFTQGERRYSGPQGGLGIGLGLAKRLVELHGGTVRAHSEGPGRGAVFTVELPRAPVPAVGDAVEGEPR